MTRCAWTCEAATSSARDAAPGSSATSSRADSIRNTTPLSAGPSPSSVASTIIDVTGDVPRVLRPGPLEADRLMSVAPDLRLLPAS